MLALHLAALASNPLITHIGMADPHVHVWPSDPTTAWMYATHDCSPSGGRGGGND